MIATGNAYRLTNKVKITDFKLLSSEKEDEKSKGNASIAYALLAFRAAEYESSNEDARFVLPGASIIGVLQRG